MLQLEAPVVQREELGDACSRLTLAAPQLAARAQPGHVLAIRPAGPALDPLVRTAVALAGAAPGPGTVSLLLTSGRGEPALHGARQVDILGPIGKGWTLEGWQRNLLLIGTDVEVGALLFLAGSATGRNVALLVGAAQESEPLPASLLAPSVEYQSGRGPDAAEAALDLLDDALLRWADVIFTTLPPGAYPSLARRIRSTRLRWDRGFAHGLLLPPMMCFTGICDTCLVPEARTPWRACVDGPRADVRDFVR